MRLVSRFRNEGEVSGLQRYLQEKGIVCYADFDSRQEDYCLWVIDEDDFESACTLHQKWIQGGKELQVQLKREVKAPSFPQPAPTLIRKVSWNPPSRGGMTRAILFLCIVIFLVNVVQEHRLYRKPGGMQVGLTPIQSELLFDYPLYLVRLDHFLQEYPISSTAELKELPLDAQRKFQKIETIPTWKGVFDLLSVKGRESYRKLASGSLFGKIRQGEVWRLITPVLLHANFFHILFNMAWLWMLGRQIESRIGPFRLLILSVIIGGVSNVAQYLITGPVFVGYSGIVVGMVGFIWMRKKIAPSEGYPLERAVILYTLIFVLAMLAIDLFLSGLQLFHFISQSTNIANTAHLIGGLCGILLARCPFFRRIYRERP